MGKAFARVFIFAAIGGFVVACALSIGRYWSSWSVWCRSGRTLYRRGLTMANQALTQSGGTYAQYAVDFCRGAVQYHEAASATALRLRRKGLMNYATHEHLLEYQLCARRAESLAKIVGIDGGTGIGIFDNPRARQWLRNRIHVLTAARSGIEADQPLPVGKAIVYWVTHGPREGACYDLFYYHKTRLQHYRKMFEQAEHLLQNELERQAYELLRMERDRCITYSFQPGEPVVPMWRL